MGKVQNKKPSPASGTGLGEGLSTRDDAAGKPATLTLALSEMRDRGRRYLREHI